MKGKAIPKKVTLADPFTLKVLNKLGWREKTCSLVFDFFVQFSYFEFQLIRTGFRKTRKSRGIGPNWTDFEIAAKKLQPKTIELTVSTHLDFLNNQPPGELVDEKGELVWRLPSEEQSSLVNRKNRAYSSSDFNLLCLLLRRVRNNLFHGTKAQDTAGQVEWRMRECLDIVSDLRGILELLT